MRFFEFATPHKMPLTEGARIMHAEDLVIFEGSAGALRAVNNIAALLKSKDRGSLSIKWDGSPALVCGRRDDGTFVMTDKSGWGAKGYDGHYTSAKDFVTTKQSRAKVGADNEDYLNRITSLWPIMEAAFPAAYRGFVFGDMMWFPGQMGQNTARWVFTPNTVTYEVDKVSELGQRVARGKAGFAVHSFFHSETDRDPVPLQGTAGLNLEGPLCVLGPEIKNEAPLQADKAKIKQVTQHIKSVSKLIDTFLDPAVLAAAKMTGLPDIMYTYVNDRTKGGDFDDLTGRFVPWLQSFPKLSKTMAAKVVEYASANGAAVAAIFDVWNEITHLKESIVRQLDQHEGPVIAHVAGQRGGEGYVNTDAGGNIKMVNRLGFSAANFSKVR